MLGTVARAVKAAIREAKVVMGVVVETAAEGGTVVREEMADMVAQEEEMVAMAVIPNKGRS